MTSKKLFLASAILMALGTASCGGNTPASSATSTGASEGIASSVEVPASEDQPDASSVAPVDSVKYETPKIDKKIPKEIPLDAEIDMDEYVTISSGAPYELVVASGEVSVEGHIVRADGYGPFSVQVVCGPKKKAYDGTVISQEKYKVNQALGEISDNFVVDIAGPTGAIGTFTKTSYGWFYDYVEQGEIPATAAGMAKLSDGHWWEFIWDAEQQVANFPAGTYNANGDNYFGGMPLALQTSQFVEVFDDDENVTIRLASKYNPFYDPKDSAGSLYIVETLTGGALEWDNLFDTLLVEYVDADTTHGEELRFIGGISKLDGSVAATKYTMTIHDWNTTDIPDLQAKIASKFLPESISDEHIVAAINPITQAKNMTVTVSAGWTDKKGNPVEAPVDSKGNSWGEGLPTIEGVGKVTDDGLDYESTTDGGFFKVGKNPANPESPFYMYWKDEEGAETTQEITAESFTTWASFYGISHWTEENIHNLNIASQIADLSTFSKGYTSEKYEGVSKVFEVKFGNEDNVYSYGETPVDILAFDLGGLIDGRYNGSAIGYYAGKGYIDCYVIIYENGNVGFELGLSISSDANYIVYLTFSDIGTTVLPDNYMDGAEFPAEEPGEEEPVTSEQPVQSEEPAGSEN